MEKIMNGQLVSDNIINKVKENIKNFDLQLTLTVVQVGEDPASSIYIKYKEIACNKAGIKFNHIKYASSIKEEELIKKIDELNINKLITGIIVQLPLPKHINKNIVLNKINPLKDVDGLTSENLGNLFYNNYNLTPCTAEGILSLIKYYKINVSGKNVVILGRSILVGKPLANMIINMDATVTICHSKTKNIEKITSKADILVVAIGKKHFINKEMVKENAVVIDVGINREAGKIYGDVNFEDVVEKASLITPVPKGVGPMTVAALLSNTLKAYHLQKQ